MNFFTGKKLCALPLPLLIASLFLLPFLAQGTGATVTVCDACLKSHHLPFYCPINPDLFQCTFPVCPKICEVIEQDPSKRHMAPPAPPPLRFPPHLKSYPRVPAEAYARFAPMGRTMGHDSHPPKVRKKQTYMSLGRSMSTTAPPTPYNPDTCEFSTPNLKRLRPNSKYVEFRPDDKGLQVNDIIEMAAKFGLAMAEFCHPHDWWAVEKSSVLEIVSAGNTEENPRIFYAFGVKEEGGKYKHLTDNSTVTYGLMDPRVFGRLNEKCGVLSYVIGADKQKHLLKRFVHCDESMGGAKVAYGLFMYPPGSLCYRRSDEECGMLKDIETGKEENFHNLIQIGQTVKRFIYLYTDQRTWQDANAYCDAMGLRLLDLDPSWTDAPRVGEVVEHFLREAKLNPVAMFWTSGQFDKHFSDGKFRWTTMGSEQDTKSSPPPYPFSWWDDQEGLLKDGAGQSRRNAMSQPCVALALNPQEGGDRPKLNFKAWYCDFPMFFLCYKELAASDKIGGAGPNPTTPPRPKPANDSCELLTTKPVSNVTDGENGQGEGDKTVAPPAPPPETFELFDEETCSSKSLTARRLTPTSKFVEYIPPSTGSRHSVEEIKEHCKKLHLIPGEIRTQEDWDSIVKSGIGGVLSEDDTTANYLYVVGTDDTMEEGKLRYDSDNSEMTFSMFTTEGSTNKEHSCTVLEAVPDWSGKSRGLIMEHIDCKAGLEQEDKVPYGLCMFPRDWKCFKDSGEERAGGIDIFKFVTIIALGVTETRSIFFNPAQRKWEEAMGFCESAGLKLLDFDPEWKDVEQVVKIFEDKLKNVGGLFQLTPFWTSGKLAGTFQDKVASWDTTKNPISFPSGDEHTWMYMNPSNNLSQFREGSIPDACVEASFDGAQPSARLRPDYCDTPKYFLCYRKSRRREDDPVSENTIGITLIEEEDELTPGEEGDKVKREKEEEDAGGIAVKGTNEKESEENENASKEEEGDDHDDMFDKDGKGKVPFDPHKMMSQISSRHEDIKLHGKPSVQVTVEQKAT